MRGQRFAGERERAPVVAEPHGEAREVHHAPCYPVGVSMWSRGVRVVNIDEALARERLVMCQVNAAAAEELAAVLLKKQEAERQRREAVRGLRQAQEEQRGLQSVCS